MASTAKMYIDKEKIAQVVLCNYLGVSICSRKYFRTDYEKRKFRGAVDAILSHNMLSHECYTCIF